MPFDAESTSWRLRSGGPGPQIVPLGKTFVTKACLHWNSYIGSSSGGAWSNASIGIDVIGGPAASMATGDQKIGGTNFPTFMASDGYSANGLMGIPILINASRFLGRTTAAAPGQFTFTTIYNGPDAEQTRMQTLAMGGDDVDYAGIFFEPLGVGSFDLDFGIPNLRVVIAVACPTPRGADRRGQGAAPMGFGWSVRCDSGGSCTAVNELGFLSTMNAACYQRSARLCATVNPTGNLITNEIAVSNWTTAATKITVDVLARNPPIYYFLLGIGGHVGANAGVLHQGDLSAAYKAQAPRAVVFASVGKPTGTTVQRDMNLSLGMGSVPPTEVAHPGGANAESITSNIKDASAIWQGKGYDTGFQISLKEADGQISAKFVGGAYVVTLGSQLMTLADALIAVPWNDGSLREVAFLVLGLDTPGDHPCGDGEPSALAASCPSGVGVLNQAYSSSVGRTGGTGPFTFAIVSGGLPTGLSLNGATGAITGTPTVLGTFSFSIVVTDSLLATASIDCSIDITPPGGGGGGGGGGGADEGDDDSACAATVQTLGCPTTLASVGVGYGSGITSSLTGSTFAILSGVLPPGLALTPSTGEIVGVPTTAGTYSFLAAALSTAGIILGTIDCAIVVVGPSVTPPLIGGIG